MNNTAEIIFEKVNRNNLPIFISRIQEAFSITMRKKFGIVSDIPTTEEIEELYTSKETQTYFINFKGNNIGGVIIKINNETQENFLELFYISEEYHNQNLGFITWKAIEKKYPSTTVWRTITPYFEERNIYFYVNKCGFHIVKFVKLNNEKDSSLIDLSYFCFEKVMK